MDPATLALLTSALGTGLVTVLNKLLEKGVVDPALEKGLEPLKELLTRGYDKRRDEAKLRKAIEAALKEATGSPNTDQWAQYRWVTALESLKSNPALAACAAAAAVEMTGDDPAHVPPDLLKELKIEDERAAFATFLFKLREKLVNVEGYGEGLHYADRLEQQGLLRQQLHLARREIEIDEALLAHRRLTTDDDRALRGYIAEVRRLLEHMPLPLTRLSGPEARADAGLAQVFVPLALRDTQAEAEARRQALTPDPSPVAPRARYKRVVIKPDELRPASFGEVFNRYPCFLLVAPPGSGKTTLLRRAALAFVNDSAQDDLGWIGAPLLPVFLRLRHFGLFLAENRAKYPSATHGALTAFMENYFQHEYRLMLSAGFFDRRLDEGRCLILLDGLDEVTTNREAVATCVADFVKAYRDKGNRFGLASRPKGYESVEVFLRSAAPALAEVNPLGPEGITQLIGNLIRALVSDPVQQARDTQDLPRRILANADLTRIAGTPLFCTALVLVYKYRGARLPERRVDVYQEIVDLLLGFWKAQESGMTPAQEMPRDDGTGAAYAEAAVALKKRRLAHLAYWMQTERLTDAPADRARETLAAHICQQERKDESTAALWAENFLFNSHERGGVFVEADPGRYAFPHQGFREYLAATALKDRREAEFIQTALAHLTDDWWEHVILLAGAHPELSNATRGYFVEELLHAAQDPQANPQTHHARVLMAGQCAADMAGYLPGPQREAVERQLLHLCRDTGEGAEAYPDDKPLLTSPKLLPPQTRLEAGLLLDSLGWTPPDLYDFLPLYNTNSRNLTYRNPPKSKNPLFLIARYPVTNLQYARFLDAPDYADETLWQSLVAIDLQSKPHPIGEKALEWFRSASEKGKRVPRLWDDARFGASHRLLPVVGVTWYEAATYCAWLTRHWRELEESSNSQFQTSNPQFRLPLEHEWIAAAGGEEGDRYPWSRPPLPAGDREASPEAQRSGEGPGVRVNAENIALFANTSESDLDRTTPVCMYPAGVSYPHGIMDMSGNVWEWQANFYDKDRDWLTLRGGAWRSGMDYARVAVRFIYHPGLVWLNYGLRVVDAAPVSRS